MPSESLNTLAESKPTKPTEAKAENLPSKSLNTLAESKLTKLTDEQKNMPSESLETLAESKPTKPTKDNFKFAKQVKGSPSSNLKKLRIVPEFY